MCSLQDTVLYCVLQQVLCVAYCDNLCSNFHTHTQYYKGSAGRKQHTVVYCINTGVGDVQHEQNQAAETQPVLHNSVEYVVAIDIMTLQGMYSIVVGGSWNKVFVRYSIPIIQFQRIFCILHYVTSAHNP